MQILERGWGVNQDYSKAIKYYQLAAEQGHARAQYNIGVLYENGDGVAQDYNEAAKYYRLAAEQGHDRAKERLEILKNNH